MVALPLSPMSDDKNYPHSLHSLVRLFIRFIQFILAITVCGLYGVDLAHGTHAHVSADGKWIFAEFVAGLTAVSVFAYLSHWRWLVVLDFVLFILWTALFGLFGSIYIPAHPTPRQGGQRRMKNAVWVDLIEMLSWFVTFLSGLFIWWRTRNVKTLHTGRATV